MISLVSSGVYFWRQADAKPMKKRWSRVMPDLRIGFSGNRLLESIVGNVESAEVGDVLPQRQIAIDLLGQAGRRGVAVVLRYQFAGQRLETGGIFLRPPLLEIARGSKARALVVIAVRELVADGRADGAVVQRVIGVRVEERRLQDRC